MSDQTEVQDRLASTLRALMELLEPTSNGGFAPPSFMTTLSRFTDMGHELTAALNGHSRALNDNTAAMRQHGQQMNQHMDAMRNHSIALSQQGGRW